jgi:hypothetical protein
MKAVFGSLLLAALLAAAEAKADPGPDPAPARSSASTASSRFRPAQLWGGIGFYNTSVSVCVGPFCGSNSSGQFGINGGGSYAFPINPDMSWLGFGNLALAFGSFTSVPITVGGGIRGEHIGPIQLSGLAGLSVVPISGGGGTKVGLALGAQGNYPIPQVMPHLGVQGAFMIHILSDSVTVWTLNAGVSYTLPY